MTNSAATQQTFLRYYQDMHLNGFGVAIYDIGDPHGKLRLAVEKQGSAKQAFYGLMTQDELDEIKGNQAGKLAQLIEQLSGGELSFTYNNETDEP